MNATITIADIEFVIREKFENTAQWRRSILEEYPADRRNEEAAEMLERLAGSVAEADEDLLLAYNRLFERDDDDCYTLIELENEFLRDVGFDDSYASAAEFIERFVAAAQRREIAA